MALRIRMRQQGRNNRAFYRIVVTDSRSPRDGKYIEMVGWYNPVEQEIEKNLLLKADRIQHWLGLGAQLTGNVGALIARGAPHVHRQQTEKVVASRAKAVAKRRAMKQAEKAKV